MNLEDKLRDQLNVSRTANLPRPAAKVWARQVGIKGKSPSPSGASREGMPVPDVHEFPSHLKGHSFIDSGVLQDSQIVTMVSKAPNIICTWTLSVVKVKAALGFESIFREKGLIWIEVPFVLGEWILPWENCGNATHTKLAGHIAVAGSKVERDARLNAGDTA